MLIELINDIENLVNIIDNSETNGKLNGYWNGNGVIIKCIDLPNLIKLGESLAIHSKGGPNDLDEIERVLASNVFVSIPGKVEDRKLEGYNPQIDVILKNVLILMLNIIRKDPASTQLITLIRVNIVDKLIKLLIQS